MCCVFFFFFFQAEDGIRDTSVTGVQTCALPILPLDWFRPSTRHGADGLHSWCRHCNSAHANAWYTARAAMRSEERRVGKGCRCGWEGEDCKKKGNGHTTRRRNGNEGRYTGEKER